MLVVYYKQFPSIVRSLNWRIKLKQLNQDLILVIWQQKTEVPYVLNKIPDVAGFVKKLIMPQKLVG